MNVFSNLAISLDGKIADQSQPSKPLGTIYDRQQMQVIRKKADVILVGAGTLRAHPMTMKLKQKLTKFQSQPANAVITASGKLDPKWSFWADPSVVRLIFTTRQGLPLALEACQDRALVFDVGEERVDMSKVFAKLKELNFKNVLVEGGGETMAEVLKANLLKELYVTMTPRILGGRRNPSLVGGEDTLWKNLELLKQRRVKNEIYLHYKVKGAKGV